MNTWWSRQFDVEEGWSSLLFLLGVIMVAGGALAAADWTEGLRVVPEAGVVGLLTGFLLGRSVFLPGTAHSMSAAYGLAWVAFLLGRDFPAHLTWEERLTELSGRLFRWGQQAVTGGSPHDPLIFVLVASGLFWLLGYGAGWNTYRHRRVWHAVLPPGIVLVINLYYYRGARSLNTYLAAYLLFAFLYIARIHVCELEFRWGQERVFYEPGRRYGLLTGGLVIVLLGLLLAWTAPGVASVPALASTWQQVSRPWETVREEWTRLFSTLEGSSAVGLLEPFGETLTPGGPRRMEDVVLMDIEAPQEGRYFWRGAVYALYDGRRWLADEKERLPLSPNRPPPGLEESKGRRLVEQRITNYVPGRTLLVGAADPLTVDRPAEAHIHLNADAPLEMLRLFSTEPLQAGEAYRVTSLVSEADIAGLRAAGEGYPDWVRRRYLQLPAGLPARLVSLAETITAGAHTPYDRATALEEYLRHHITYTLSPPAVPPGRDYVDYLLFESHRGYCNGYASAMVILARCVGIPARLAVGYSEGEYDARQRMFRIRELNTHSWPEVYFPGYGWVQFEPTVTEEPIVRPEGLSGQRPGTEAGLRPGEPEGREGWQRVRPVPEWDEEREALGIEPLASGVSSWVWWSVAVLAGSIALVGAGLWAVEERGLRHLSSVERAYGRLLRFGRYLGRPRHPSETPFEWAGAFGKLVPEAQEPLERIVTAYARFRFAAGKPASPEAEENWRIARPLLWKRWLRRARFRRRL